jgi:hypothetical protein
MEIERGLRRRERNGGRRGAREIERGMRKRGS